MRIAWIGPMPSADGGVPSMATQQLLGLSAAGIEIEAFVSCARGSASAVAARPAGACRPSAGHAVAL